MLIWVCVFTSVQFYNMYRYIGMYITHIYNDIKESHYLNVFHGHICLPLTYLGNHSLYLFSISIFLLINVIWMEHIICNFGGFIFSLTVILLRLIQLLFVSRVHSFYCWVVFHSMDGCTIVCLTIYPLKNIWVVYIFGCYK